MSDPTVENPHAGQGMVVLDIGGEVGALVVSAPANLAGTEIEICPSGARDGTPDEGAGWWHGRWRSHNHDDATSANRHPDAPAWPHVAVVARHTGSGTRHCAVYPGLRGGNYDLWLRPEEPTALTVTVLGAEVTWADWPAAARE